MRHESNWSLRRRKVSAIAAIALVVGSGFSSVSSWSEVQNPSSGEQGSLYGVVYAKGARPGDDITLSVTTHPEEMEGIPGVEAVTFPADEVPTKQVSGADGPSVASLDGISVDLGDGPQPANKPITRKIPWDAAFNIINVFLTDRPQHRIGGGTMPILTSQNNPPTETSVTNHKPGTSDYNMPPITTPGSVTVIEGPSTGNANHMSATLNGQPLKIIAAIPGKSFIDVPKSLPLAVDGSGQAKWEYRGGEGMPPVEITTGRASLGMYAGRTMMTGQTEEMTVMANISGVADWGYSLPSASLVSAGAIKGMKESKDNASGDGGAVVMVVKNRTKDVIEMDDFVWVVHQRDVVNGVATKKVKMRARRRGNFRIDAKLIPYLPQSTGRAVQIARTTDSLLALNQPDGVPVSDQTGDSDKEQTAEKPREKKEAGKQALASDKAREDASSAVAAWMVGILSRDELFQALLQNDPHLLAKVANWQSAKATQQAAKQALQLALQNQKTLDLQNQQAATAQFRAKSATDTSRARADLVVKDIESSPAQRDAALKQFYTDDAVRKSADLAAQQAATAAAQAAQQATQASKALGKADKAVEDAAKAVDPELRKTVERLEQLGPPKSPQERVQEAGGDAQPAPTPQQRSQPAPDRAPQQPSTDKHSARSSSGADKELVSSLMTLGAEIELANTLSEREGRLS